MAENEFDPTKLSFSQAQGYEPLPRQMKLEELSREARTRFWNVLYEQAYDQSGFSYRHRDLKGVWHRLIRSVHAEFFGSPSDEWNERFDRFTSFYRPFLLASPFNKVFDLLTFLMRRKECPPEFIQEIGKIFRDCRLAYRLDESYPPTIYPAATPQEGEATIEALQQLREAGLVGAQQHLANASACINSGDWAGGVRESIHAVESVARQVAPGDEKALGSALQKLEDEGVLQHRALRKAFEALYGYTSDEQGIRHALLEQGAPNVGLDEAVFMLGACASFASYLCRKQQALPGQGEGGA